MKQMENYFLDTLLYTQVLDESTNSMVKRVVVPTGGLRSFRFNGYRYRPTLRKTLLLLYHDFELIGAHPGVRETLSKIKEHFWWPSLEHDVRRWVGTCAVCRAWPRSK